MMFNDFQIVFNGCWGRRLADRIWKDVKERRWHWEWDPIQTNSLRGPQKKKEAAPRKKSNRIKKTELQKIRPLGHKNSWLVRKGNFVKIRSAREEDVLARACPGTADRVEDDAPNGVVGSSRIVDRKFYGPLFSRPPPLLYNKHTGKLHAVLSDWDAAGP